MIVASLALLFFFVKSLVVRAVVPIMGGGKGVMIAVIHSHSLQPLSAEITAVSVGPQPTDGSCPAPTDSLINVKRKSIGIRLDLCLHTLNRPWQRGAAFLFKLQPSARISSCSLLVLTLQNKTTNNELDIPFKSLSIFN